MPVSLNYLASHSRNLESLLQTYRQINLTIQSVFFVLGTFLLSRILETESKEICLYLEVLLISLTLFSTIVMTKFQKVITARGDDVTWWHRKIVRAEQELPRGEQTFTEFKIYQSRDVLSDSEVARFHDPGVTVTDEEIDKLLHTDLDHIRNVINSYILRGLRLLWIILNLISLGACFYKNVIM
ncbi:hypothetical protein LLG96_03630 [bacterium]|nr:hypothetical protein [bacterium]